MKSHSLKLLGILFLLAPLSVAALPTLHIDPATGKVLGAFGVNVGGALYDVEFLDGTCVALFDGCDSISDFTFQSEADAKASAQALLDFVFLDGPLGLFDTDPSLTSGCTSLAQCNLFTPYGFSPVPNNAFFSVMTNTSSGSAEGVSMTAFEIDVMPAGDSSEAFARWTPVPEPTTLLLLGLGLAGLGFARKRLH